MISVFLALTAMVGFVASVVVFIFRKSIRSFIHSDNHGHTSQEVQPFLSVEMIEEPKSFSDQVNWSNELTLEVNGKEVTLVNPDPDELLVDFIRNNLGLKGTKLGCEEGGCGACTVILKKDDVSLSVNSCLRPLCANDGMSITTVEGVGSLRGGLSEEQKRLVAHYGTQCGYCTPGWITNMSALNAACAETDTAVTKRQIETYLDGNICRCTGYRPIIQAFQTFGDESAGAFDSARGNMCEQLQCSSERQNFCGDHDLCGQNDLEEAHLGLSKLRSVDTPSTQVGITQRNCSQPYRPHTQKTKKGVKQPLFFHNPVTRKKWYRPVTLQQMCAVLNDAWRQGRAGEVQIVGGNTSIGVTKYFNNSAPYYSKDPYTIFVDVNDISQMTAQTFDASSGVLSVGAAVPLHALAELMLRYASPVKRSVVLSAVEQTSGSVVNHHSIFSVTGHHLLKIASTQVRNVGTWAGNLMVFLGHQEFPSDAVLALTTARARLQLCNVRGELSTMDLDVFLNISWENFLRRGLTIVSLLVSETGYGATNVLFGGLPRSVETLAETFKVAQRAKHAHAHVNAGFAVELFHSGSGAPVCVNARVVYGGVSSKTFVARRAENTLRGASLTSTTLQATLIALQADLVEVGPSTAFGSQAFRESVMQSCLYRFFLRCYPVTTLPHSLLSALAPWVKPVTRGVELFLPSGAPGCTSPTEAPVGKPVRKLEAPIQATGEAVYPSDEPLSSTGLHGAIVYSTRCAVILSSIDASEALATVGVKSVLTAVDIPGSNSVGPEMYLFAPVGEVVPCVGAPLAVVIATTEAGANAAAALVKVMYTDIGVLPISSLKQAVEQRSFFTDVPDSYTYLRQGQPEDALSTAEYRVKGELVAGGQYHFYMETQTAIAHVEDGEVLQVTCGTQDPTTYQGYLAGILGLTNNKVVVKSLRTGGAFGGKLTRGLYVSGAASLAALKMGCPVRIFNSRTADMMMQGGREEWLGSYDVGFSHDGIISSLSYLFYTDGGIASFDCQGSLFMGMNWADNAYYLPNYKADAKICFTNTPARTSMRAPGVVQSCLFTEMVLERVAKELKLPMKTVQERNFISNGQSTITGQVISDCNLSTVWNTLLQRSHFDERTTRIDAFNSKNLWRKRGLSICPVRYGIGWGGYNAGVFVGVNKADGTVTVTHSGCEIGQGINTKVAQAVSFSLGVPLSLIRISYTGTERVVNGGTTGGSGTSEVVVQAALNACQKLNDRLEPYRDGDQRESKRPAVGVIDLLQRQRAVLAADENSWQRLLSSLPYEVSLNVEGWFSPSSNPNGQMFQYFVYAACVTEVELDVLSGQVQVSGCEIVYDCGQSLNPSVDIGQIEGALVMGLGYFLTERVQYDDQAQLQSIGSWEYKPFMAPDAPAVLNVTLLKNMYNQSGILGSKGVGEPPYIISSSVYFALKMAIYSARADAGEDGYFSLDVPATVDQRQLACLVNPTRFVLPL